MYDENNNSPIILACNQIDSKVFILSYLIDQVQDQKIIAEILTHENNDGLNCYLTAAKTGSVDILKYIEGLVPSLFKLGLLSKEGTNYDPVVRHMDNNGNNALILAATSNNLNAVKHLIENTKMSLFSKNCDGFTAMLMAIDCGNLEIVECRVSHGWIRCRVAIRV